MAKKQTILTGDRPTGPLHLGHYVGSLRARVKLQDKYETFVLIADLQALTDNAEHPEKVRKNIMEVMLDYLSVGIDPKKTNIVLQSQVPELSELTMYYLNLVTLARLKRNPTVKEEMKHKGYAENVPAGFLMYPVSQAADITAFGAHLVPVGEDQLPMVEQTQEIVDKFNRIYGKTLVRPKALIPKKSRLPGIDGKTKMSKSLNNAIFLKDSPAVVKEKVMKAYTDPGHIHKENPGKVEGNVIFAYLDAFSSEGGSRAVGKRGVFSGYITKKEVAELKKHYTKGGLGDVELKQRLIGVLEEFLAPIRERRYEFEKNKSAVEKILQKGTKEGRKRAQEVLAGVRKSMKLIKL